MDLKHLTNYQLVLLVLLISFVTSIATGIVTVYLLQQSPTVSSVINQVIQRTVETVAPASEIPQSPGQVVFIKESDIVPVIISNIKKATVSIAHTCEPVEVVEEEAVPCPKNIYGFLTSAKGEFLTSEKADPASSTATIHPGTKELQGLNYQTVSKTESGFAYQTIIPEAGKTVAVPYILSFAKTLPKEGETLLIYDPISGGTKKLYVTSVNPEKNSFTVDQSLLSHIGSPIVNLDGTVSGVVLATGAGVSLVSGPEFLKLKFTQASLTNN